MPSPWSILRSRSRQRTRRRSFHLQKTERKKSHEETCVEFSFGGAAGYGPVAVSRQFKNFRGSSGTDAGIQRGSQDRQLQLWANDVDRSGGNHGDVDQSRRHPAYRGQRRQSLQIQGAGYGRKVFLHLHQARDVPLFLFHPSEDDRQSGGAVTSVGKAFDPETILLAKHAQHVVLVHFPIALFITGVAFDWSSRLTRRRALGEAAYYNLLIAAISTLPVLVTGLLAWRFQLEGQKLKGVLLLHLVLACVSTVMIWLVWWVHFRARRRTVYLPTYRLAVEVLALVSVALTAHLGGFLSGVNTPG